MTNIHASELGKLGGKKSVESRFNGKTKEEISELMKKVRKGSKRVRSGGPIDSQLLVDCLNLGVLEDNLS